jgi:hypothetical protein
MWREGRKSGAERVNEDDRRGARPGVAWVNHREEHLESGVSGAGGMEHEKGTKTRVLDRG